MKYFVFRNLRAYSGRMLLGLGAAIAAATGLPGCSDDGEGDTTDITGVGGLSSHAGATGASYASGGASGGSGSSHIARGGGSASTSHASGGASGGSGSSYIEKGGSSANTINAGGETQSGGATASSSGNTAGSQVTNPSGGTSSVGGAGGSGTNTTAQAGASSVGGASALGGAAGAAGSSVAATGGTAGSGSTANAGAAGFAGSEFSTNCPGCAVNEGCVGAVVTRAADASLLPWNVTHPLWAAADGIGALRVGIIGASYNVITMKSIDNADMTPATARFLFDLGCVPTGSLRINALLDDVDAQPTHITSSYYLDACLLQRTPGINVSAGIRTVVPLEIHNSCD